MNGLMSFAFLIALLASGYFLIRLIIAAVRKQPTDLFKKKLIASVLATVVTLVGFNVTRSPEQIAAQNEKVEAERKAAEEKKLADEKAAEEKRLADEKAAEEKRLADEKAAEEKKLADAKAAEEKRIADAKAAEERKAAEAQRKQDEITKEIATGWNLETTDTSNDGTNLLKASGLLKKYPDYIHSAAANWINVTDALKKPWDFYGKVVNLSGRIYSIEQLPPGSSAAKFFGKDCYEAMLAVGDDYDPIAIAMIIVGDSSHVSENSTVNVKGFIYGHSQLVNNMGGTNIRGLAFVGFQE